MSTFSMAACSDSYDARKLIATPGRVVLHPNFAGFNTRLSPVSSQAKAIPVNIGHACLPGPPVTHSFHFILSAASATI